MKSTVKITTCGIFSALGTVLLLGTNIPIFLYTVPAIVGILFLIPCLELGAKWAFLCYGVTSVLGLILPTEREALVMYIGLLGFYPIVKILIERLKSRLMGTVLKTLLFNAALVGCFLVIIKVLGLNVLQNEHFSATVMAVGILLIGNLAFIVYDIALTRGINLYFIKFRRSVRRALRMKNDL